MANVFCSSTGSNTAPYETWAKAATTFTTAVGAATLNGDIIAVDATNTPADVAATTTWTFLNNVSVIASTNSGTSTITPTTMGTATWLGANASFSVTFSGAFKVYFYGITVRVGGTGTSSITVNGTDGGNFVFESCYLWVGTTSTGSRLNVSLNTGGSNGFTYLKDTTVRFGQASQRLVCAGDVRIDGGGITSAGTAPTIVFGAVNNAVNLECEGFDVSHAGAGTLVESFSGSSTVLKFARCRLGSGMTILATQTPANKSSAKVFLFDCSSGDTHGLFGYYDAFGSCISNTGIFFTSGAAAQSWQIVTTANCSFFTPFVSPWIDAYNTGTSAITPYLEILRDGSTTAYTDAQVWGEFSTKTTSGFVTPTFSSDRQALVNRAAGTAGANQAAGAGLASWTGESGTAWSGKVDSGAAVTPAEAGAIRGRLVVGAASITVYVDPQIRT